MAEVKWIKLSTSMFDDEKIRLIEGMPEADSILIIWIKLLSQAGKTNASGYIYLNENIPYTEEMLATLFHKPLNIVRLALGVFKQFGMINIDENNFISIENWEKHQNTATLDKIREDTRKRVQRYREKQKKIGSNDSGNEECNVTSRYGNDIRSKKEEVRSKKEEVRSKKEDKDKELQEQVISSGGAYRTFEQEGFGTISPIIAEKIEYMISDYSEPWVVEAMKVAVINGKRSINYVEGILKRWKANGIDTGGVKNNAADQEADDPYAGYDFNKELPPNF